MASIETLRNSWVSVYLRFWRPRWRCLWWLYERLSPEWKAAWWLIENRKWRQ